MKTINEAAREYVMCDDYPNCDVCYEFVRDEDAINSCCSRTDNMAFHAGVKFAQQWISVEDELPEECEEVLVKCTNGKRIQHDVDFRINGKFRRKNVIYWRQIELK